MFSLKFVAPWNLLHKKSWSCSVGLSLRKTCSLRWYSHRYFTSSRLHLHHEDCERGESVFTISKYFMKLRNPGGFKLPPVIPANLQDLQRAVSLLGHRTQGYLTAPRVIELIQLVGAYPLDKETAQQWKGALELYQKKKGAGVVNMDDGELPNTRPSRFLVYREGQVVGSVLYSKFMDVIAVPQKDEDVSRVFRILGLFRERGFLLDEEAEKLKNLIGYIPRNSREAKRVSNALKRLVHARVIYERLPPVIPEEPQTILQLAELLYKVERYGTAGEQGDAYIKNVLKGFPRNENVAKWWYKRLLTIYYTRQRRKEAEERRKYLEDIREEKKERRKQRLVSIFNESYQIGKHMTNAWDEFSN